MYNVVLRKWSKFTGMRETVIYEDCTKEDATNLCNELNKSADSITEIFEVKPV